MLNRKVVTIIILFIGIIEFISCFTLIEQNPKPKTNDEIHYQSNQLQLLSSQTEKPVDIVVAIDGNTKILNEMNNFKKLNPSKNPNNEFAIMEYETPSMNDNNYNNNNNLIKHFGIDDEIDKNSQCSSPDEFNYYDYAVVLGMLVISLGIGVFYGFFQKSGSTSNDFLLGSGMTLLPVTLSLTTSFITAIELLGNPSEMFYHGTQFSLIIIPMLMVIPVAIKIFYPIYFKLELTSCYEYLGIRFGRDIRIFGAILYIIQMNFYTAVAVLAPAIALSKATGLNTRIAVVLIYIVCVFYSSQGGMKAVVIADTFQACVLALSLVMIVILGHYFTGGFFDLINASAENNRLEFFNFDPNPTTRHTVFSVVIGGFFYWTSLFCTNQASVQKCMSLKSLKLAKIALGLAVGGLIIVFIMNFYTGLMVYEHYSGCDPLSSGRIDATDQLLPFYVMDTFDEVTATSGIFVAGIFAASLGTVASALNSMAGVTCEDLLTNGLNIKIPLDKGATYAKWISLGYGVISFGLVFIVERLGGVLQATLTLNGLIGGVTLGLFVLGITFHRANAKGAFYGGILALIIVVYIGVMAQITNVEVEPLPLSTENCPCTVANVTKEIVETKIVEFSGFSAIYHISYMWYSMLGTMLTIFFGLIISLIHDGIQKYNIHKLTKRNDHINNKHNADEPQKKIISNSNYDSDFHHCNIEKSGIDNIAVNIDS